MRILSMIGLFSASILALSGGAFAAEPHTVTFKMDAVQQSLRDASQFDTYKSAIKVDGWASSTIDVTCSAGTKGMFGYGRRDETCEVTGKGAVVNPTTKAEIPRILYSGGFKIKADGYTNGATILANYQKVGSAPATNEPFGGSVIMKPENPSQSAKELGKNLLAYLEQNTTDSGGGVTINTEMDTIRFDRFTVPDVGGRNTADCTWTGDVIYAYANDAWQMKLDAKCGEQIYKLEGNMPWLDVEDKEHQAEYVLNLMPSGGAANDPFAEADPFAQVDGIVGTLKITTSDVVEVQIGENETDEVPVNVTAEGSFVGTNVPVELTYSFAQVLGIFARTYFGA